jgi:hypothetical protein
MPVLLWGGLRPLRPTTRGYLLKGLEWMSFRMRERICVTGRKLTAKVAMTASGQKQTLG